MLSRIKTIFNPGVYHGGAARRGYFEGWYYKLADPSLKHVVAVIPGIAFDREGRDAHAFIQLLSGGGIPARYFRYPVTDFNHARDQFEIQIGDSRFSADGIELNVSQPEGSLRGRLAFSDLKPWPVTLRAPGAMGWYAYVPFMECYHGVLSFDHGISGKLEIDGQPLELDGGRGYIEKDWGRSFPQYHIWCQCNHFETPETSLMLSLARIPWLGGFFNGFICGFWRDGRLYRLATYTGARIGALKVTDAGLSIEITSRRYRLCLEANRPGGSIIRAPRTGSMEGRLSESLDAVVQLEFYEIQGGRERRLFAETGRAAGLEVAGSQSDIRRLESEINTKA